MQMLQTGGLLRTKCKLAGSTYCCAAYRVNRSHSDRFQECELDKDPRRCTHGFPVTATYHSCDNAMS